MPPQVVRHQFGPAPHSPVFTPFEGFEPIIIDLSKRRKKRRLMNHLRLGLLISAVTIAALCTAAFFVLQPAPVAPASTTEAYFIPATPMLQPAPAPVPVAQETPHLTLPPIPQEVLSPEAAALIPVLEKLPVADDFVPKNKIGKIGVLSRATERQTPARLSISVVHDGALERHDKFIAQAAEAVKAGKNEAAIKLYTAALNAVPDDRDAAYNLVSLLLQKAALFDKNGSSSDAVALYERILKIWGERDALSQSVRQRLEWIKQKPAPLLATEPTTETTEISE